MNGHKWWLVLGMNGERMAHWGNTASSFTIGASVVWRGNPKGAPEQVKAIRTTENDATAAAWLRGEDVGFTLAGAIE